jgi:hypothetical protein
VRLIAETPCARGVLARRSAVRFAAVTDIGARDGDRRTIPDRLGDEMARGVPPVAGVVCTAVGLMEGFEGDRGGQHERDDDGGEPDEGLLAAHPGFHGGGGGRMRRAAQAVPTGTVARYRYQ